MLLAAPFAFACAHPAPPQPPTAPSAEAATIVAEAEDHLSRGLANLDAGHLHSASREFDRAVLTLLAVPGGAHSDPALSEAYRRILDVVHQRELEAMAAADGFSEPRTETAAIDTVSDLARGLEPQDEADDSSLPPPPAGDFPVASNAVVRSFASLYAGRLHDWFAEALGRGGRYLPHIQDTFAAEGLPRELASVALVESAFKPHALSRAGARGIWQFMPRTGLRYGLRQDWWVDERCDPFRATRAAARYLKELKDAFGDWDLALAAYNGGENRVRRAVSRAGKADFWRLRRGRALAPETRSYVPLVHAAILVARSPEAYGIRAVPDPPADFETIAVTGPLDLRTAAECAGTSLEALQVLNPQLRRDVVPPADGFSLRVPGGAGQQAVACLATIPDNERVRFHTHVVEKGETLSQIAARYRTTVASLAGANGISRPNRIAAGQEIIVPRLGSRSPGAATLARKPTPPARSPAR